MGGSRRGLRSASGALAVVGGLFLSGCYASQAVPVESLRPAVGSEVVVRLTPSGAGRLEETTGRTDRVLQGRLQERPVESIMLAVPSLEAGRSISSTRLREIVVIPVSDVESVELRELSGTKTALTIAAGVGAAVLTAALVFGWATGASGDDPPTGEVPFAPGFRFSVP